MTWYHPKYYAALRAERKKLQAQEGTSVKRVQPEVASNKQQAVRNNHRKIQATSGKLQAISNKLKIRKI